MLQMLTGIGLRVIAKLRYGDGIIADSSNVDPDVDTAAALAALVNDEVFKG